MIFGRHSVLKRGCSVWNKQEMPEEEFQARLEAIRREMAERHLDALVVYGDNLSYADLCYVTNYFPKVRGGLALIPRSGPLSLLLNIGSRDVPFAKSLTWVDDVRASGQLGRDGARFFEETNLSRAKIGLIDSGKGFPLAEVEQLQQALPQAQWEPSHSMLEPMRLRKSARELDAMRDAGRVVNEICEEASSIIRSGKKEYELVAEIDRLARNKGVEDIRILAGEKRLNPPSFKQAASVGTHWAVYFAVQHERYWAEAGRTYFLAHDTKVQSTYGKAQGIVAAMAQQLKPNGSVVAIDETARKALGEFYATASVYGLANGIGLNQWEAPFLSESDAREVGASSVGATTLNEDMTLALRVTIETEGKIVLFGDSFQVTAGGARSLLGG
jgi:Xaa-Pro aminopeptidase